MMDLHYISGIILFFSSVIGCVLPFQRKIDLTPVRPFSTGIVFSVALCHLLPDSSQILDTNEVTEWFMTVTGLRGSVGDEDMYDTLPVAETLACLGVFIMLVIDQCILCPHHQGQPSLTSMAKDRMIAAESNQKERARLILASNSIKYNHGAIVPVASSSDDDQEQETMTEHHKHSNSTMSNMVPTKVYATEIAIAIHSIMIGFTMGINPDTNALIGLTIAMIFHQMFEGIALAMIAVQGNLGFNACCVLVLCFSSSLPIGILIGLYVNSFASDHDDGDLDDLLNINTIIFQGIPNAIAAGMLLHIGLELMMEDFNHKDGHKFPALQLVLVFLGGSIISFLAIWG